MSDPKDVLFKDPESSEGGSNQAEINPPAQKPEIPVGVSNESDLIPQVNSEGSEDLNDSSGLEELENPAKIEIQPMCGDNPVSTKVPALWSEQEAKENEWKERRKKIPDHEEMERAFYDISPTTLFFDVKLLGDMKESIRSRFEGLSGGIELSSDKNTSDTRSRASQGGIQKIEWDDKEIERMFGKGFNPTSLVTSAESAKWFCDSLDISEQNKPLSVAELGCGAGWSTVMLYRKLAETFRGDRKFYLEAIDESLFGIATTMSLLEYYDIRYILVKNEDEFKDVMKLKESGSIESCVILRYGKFPDCLSQYPDNHFSGFYSTHGAAYLSEIEYRDLFQEMKRSGIDKSVFITDSLEPRYTTRLSKPVLISQILFPKSTKKLFDSLNFTYKYAKKSPETRSMYYSDTPVKAITIFNEHRADLIIKWCNYLVKQGEFGRLLQTIKSLSVTMEVVEAYRPNVLPSSALREKGVVGEDFSDLDGKPDFTIFLCTAGFRLNK